ncbi:hypothetical protein [Actinoplanes sp. HUAS TT8]|uniref:hypothetical protein n=1 Tax=Actinoplanes sp. HUAS TT8 TaxID=3447453 RepID=UPI003F5271CA
MTTLHERPGATRAPLSMPAYTRSSDRLSHTTRYLCSAAFAVPGFADRVVGELIGEMRRSVPPSHGFDLDPIVRQCFRVRRRDALQQFCASVLLLIAFVLNPLVVLVAAFFGVLIRISRSATLQQLLKRLHLGFLRWWIYWLLTGSAVGLGYLVWTFVPHGLLDAAAGAIGADHPWPSLIVLLGVVGVSYGFRRDDYRIITTEFAPGAAHQRRKMRDTLIEDRLAQIAAAQRGNVVVHHEDPFIGCGTIEQAWSFAITLRQRDASGIRPEQPVAIDPVELNNRLKTAIENMRADWLDEGQQVTGLSVRPYVVADGVRDEKDPVIDPVSRMPYTLADPSTVDTIVACPQGGLRQYLRVVIPVRGKAIHDENGDVILDAQALGISVSAFVHVAVEGGMLYAEFLGTVQAPLRPECRLPDTLRPEKAGAYALGGVLRNAIVDMVAGPYRLARSLRRAIRLRLNMNGSVRRAAEFRTHDYGATFSIRDLASAPDLDSFLQRLDGIKYVKLVDRIAGEAIIDYLVARGVDPLEFRQAINHITEQNTNIQIGTVSGGQNNFGGSGNTFNNGGTRNG